MEITIITLGGPRDSVADKLRQYVQLGYRITGTYESPAKVGGHIEGWCAILQKD
jgi:hypothetical protein